MRVDRIAGSAARQQPGHDDVAAAPVRDQPVRAVCHRDGDAPPAAGPAALQQRREDVDDGAERAGREVGGLNGRYPGSGVGERARPAHVVEVVARALGMPAFVAETCDRADDGASREP